MLLWPRRNDCKPTSGFSHFSTTSAFLVGAVNAVLQEDLFRHAPHSDQWRENTSGMPPVLSHPLVKPSARVWRGSDIPTHRQGVRVLGASVGHPDFVPAQLETTQVEHQVLLDRSFHCLAFSPLGHCWCIVLRPEPMTSSMFPSWVRSSPVHMTDPCVCAVTLKTLSLVACGRVVAT